jgi:hypothetical protein
LAREQLLENKLVTLQKLVQDTEVGHARMELNSANIRRELFRRNVFLQTLRALYLTEIPIRH